MAGGLVILRRAGNIFLAKKAIGGVAVAAIISPRGRAAVDALKLVKLKSNESNNRRLSNNIIKLLV